MRNIEERKYNVNIHLETKLTTAHIKLIESVTENEVYAECNPGYIKVTRVKIDGVEYEVSEYIGSYFADGEYFWRIDTNRRVLSKEKTEYLKGVANYIIKQGNEYLNNIFGGINTRIKEIY